MPKLSSMDVTIRGVTKTYEFDPATPVDSDDEGEASLQLVGEAETTEVQMASDAIYSARVSVSYTYRFDGTVEVDLEDLDGVEDADAIQELVERGEFSDVTDSIRQDLEDNIANEDWTIDEVDVEECFDEDGNTVDRY